MTDQKLRRILAGCLAARGSPQMAEGGVTQTMAIRSAMPGHPEHAVLKDSISLWVIFAPIWSNRSSLVDSMILAVVYSSHVRTRDIGRFAVYTGNLLEVSVREFSL